MRAKTQSEKEIQGTFEPSKEPIEGVEYDKYDRLPVVPKGWPPDAAKIWQDTCMLLKNAGYLSKAFIPMLRRYCFAVYQAHEAEKMLLLDGFITESIGTKGQVYQTPSHWIGVLDSANRTIQSIGAKFGFNPTDLVKIPKIKKDETEESLLK